MQMKICLHIPVKGLREAVLAALPDADLTGTPADAEIVIGNPPMEALESNANLRLLQLHSACTARIPIWPSAARRARTATPWPSTCSHPCSA